MKVLMLGVYDVKSYSRGRILWKGLLANNVAVDLVLKTGPFKYFELAKRMFRKNYDVILSTGKLTLLAAWLLKWWHRRPIVFDTFISDYDTLVLDRKLVKLNSIKAKLLWWGDKLAPKLAAKSFLDTNAHREYFTRLFNISKKTFDIVHVGSDNELFTSKPMPKGKTTHVCFYGTYIPLQGIDTIIRAAKFLEREDHITFTLVGKGQTYDECRKLAEELRVKNIEWVEYVDVTKLPGYLAKSNIALGIFGMTAKTLQVVPHKAFDAIASGRTLITADTPAAHEVFTHGKDAWLVPPGNPGALADAILALSKDAELRDTIAKNGYDLFLKHYSIKEIGKSLVSILKSALNP